MDEFLVSNVFGDGQPASGSKYHSQLIMIQVCIDITFICQVIKHAFDILQITVIFLDMILIGNIS